MILKNNRTMRAAVLLLALVLITSCFVGGTFAKYVTSGDAADHARVAKWGVTVTAHGTGDVFAKEYDAVAGQGLEGADLGRLHAELLAALHNGAGERVLALLLERERRGDFGGGTVQVIPHITNEIKRRFYRG